MRILYDGRIYSMQMAGGINRYFANIISRLPPNFAPSLLVEQSREVNYPSHANLRIHKFGTLRFNHISHRLSAYSSQLEDYYLRNFTARKRFDVAHPTYYTLLTRSRVGDYRCPVVITVWDMIHELFPAQMDPTGLHAEEKRRAIMSAQAVICISENTKKDLLERYSVPESKVTVTYLASEIDGNISHGVEPVPSRPYFLFVGSRAVYKNFDALLVSLSETVSMRPEASLCVVGTPFNDSEQKLIAELRLTNHIEYYGLVGDRHLAKLYRQSIALVYPTLYEGFGIPPLEAMACGTVVVASNCSSIPEVVGDAGLLFDPGSKDELTDVLLSLVNNPAQREQLIVKGNQRVQEFNWNMTAARTLDVYQSVCN